MHPHPITRGKRPFYEGYKYKNAPYHNESKSLWHGLETGHSSGEDRAGAGYVYDTIGNMRNKGSDALWYTPDASRSYTHTQPHAVTSVISGTETLSMAYDANGNMLTRGDFVQEWDVENRLVAVTNTVTSEVTRFFYDPSGQRVRTVEAGRVTITPFPNYEVQQRINPPTVAITANGQSPLTVNYGVSFTVAWSSTGADSCTASGDWDGAQVVNGSQLMQGIYGGVHSYSIRCENAAGSSSATVQVTVAMPPPTITFLANGTTNLSVLSGKSYTLAWNTDAVTASCSASGAWSGARALSGSQKITGYFDSIYYYHLTCISNGGVSATQTVKVTVGGGGGGLDPVPWDTVVAIEEGKAGAPLMFKSSEEGLPETAGDGGYSSNEALAAIVTTITRKTYSVAGQAIAVRVSGDPNAANNGLFYMHSDHLGSTSAMSYGFDPDGSGPVNAGDPFGTTTRYTPFGDTRTGGQSDITDRGFTGQKSNPYIKLVDMKARWYAPAMGRFISPDTIVPDPANPQSLNRYSYVRNNPLNYTDPTGHSECGVGQYHCAGDDDPQQDVELPGEVPMLSQMDNTFSNPWTSCGPTAVTMCLNYLGVDVSTSAVINDAIDERLYTPDVLPFTSPDDLTRMGGSYSSKGILVWSGNFDNPDVALSVLRSQLEKGHPVIADITINNDDLSVDTAHFVVITGVDADNTVHFIDPYTMEQGVSNVTQDWNTFWSGWRNNSDRGIKGLGYFLVFQRGTQTNE